MKIKDLSLVIFLVFGMVFLGGTTVSSYEEDNLDMNSPVFEDLDMDNYDDVVGMYNSRVKVYLNDGTGYFDDTGQNLGQSDVACFDLTSLYSSGTLYILTGENGKTSIYENDGTGYFSYKSQVTYTFSTTVIASGDTDSDGDKDVAFGHSSGVIIYENEGSFTFTSTSNSFSVSNPKSVKFNDVDSDGDLDLVVENDQSVTSIYYNDGSGNFN